MLITLLLSATPLLNPAMCPQEPVQTTNSGGWIIHEPSETTHAKTYQDCANSLSAQADTKRHQAKTAKQARKAKRKATKARKAKRAHGTKTFNKVHKNKAKKHQQKQIVKGCKTSSSCSVKGQKASSSCSVVSPTSQKAHKTAKKAQNQSQFHKVNRQAKKKHRQANQAENKRKQAKRNRAHQRSLKSK